MLFNAMINAMKGNDKVVSRFVRVLEKTLSVCAAGVYFMLLRYGAEIFSPSAPLFALTISILSLPLSVFCIFLIKRRTFKSKLRCFAALFFLPLSAFLTLAAAAYIWNSYLGGDLFRAAWLYFNCLSLAGYILLSGIVCGITLYIFFKSQKKGGRKND